jgi:hypothetical protein
VFDLSSNLFRRALARRLLFECLPPEILSAPASLRADAGAGDHLTPTRGGPRGKEKRADRWNGGALILKMRETGK